MSCLCLACSQCQSFRSDAERYRRPSPGRDQCRAGSLVVKNGSKQLRRTSSVIPMPVSLTSRRTFLSFTRVRSGQGAPLRHRVHGVENQVSDRVAKSGGVPHDDWDVMEINFHADSTAFPERLRSHFGLVNETACSVSAFRWTG